MKNRLQIRRKFALLNSKRNFGDSKSSRFQQLSVSIGRFSEMLAKMIMSGSSKKTVSLQPRGRLAEGGADTVRVPSLTPEAAHVASG